MKASPLGRAVGLENPGATLVAERTGNAWTVTMHVPNRASAVATFTVDAATGKVLGGARLPPFPRHTHPQVIAIARASPKIHDWLSRYSSTTTIVDEDAGAQQFTVHFDAGSYGEVAQAVVDDTTGRVVSAWTGPQVAWTMARGYHYAFGRRINDPWIWLSLCVVFLVGLIDFRRLLSWRTLDLLVLLSPSISLAYFNQGLVFWSVPLVYPPLVYLLCRLVFIGVRSERRPVFAGSLPLWVLAGAAIFLIGFRGGLDRYDSNVIDVGYAGVVGADRLISGDTPYGTFPTRTGSPCGIRYADGTSQAYLQPQRGNRCESPIDLGDTYGPINYAAYVPAVAISGWTGLWDDLPAAHLTIGAVRRALRARPPVRGQTARRLAARRGARVRVGGLPVHRVRARVELERHDRHGVRDLGLRVGDLAGRTHGRCSRCPSGRSSHRSRSGRSGCATRGIREPELAEWDVRRGSRAAAATGAPRSACARPSGSARSATRCSPCAGLVIGTMPAAILLLPRRRGHGRAPSGTPRSATSSRGRRPSRSGTGGSTPACPTCGSLQAVLAGRLRARGDRLPVGAAAPRRRAARRALGRARDRLPALPELLVLHVHPLVLPVRDDRAVRSFSRALIPLAAAALARGGLVRPHGARRGPGRTGRSSTRRRTCATRTTSRTATCRTATCRSSTRRSRSR